MIISTMEYVPDKKVGQILGVVTAANKTFFSDYKAAMDEAVSELESAVPEGTQAVLGVQVSFAHLDSGKAIAIAQGTAVTLQEQQEIVSTRSQQPAEADNEQAIRDLRAKLEAEQQRQQTLQDANNKEKNSTNSWNESVAAVITQHPEGLTPNEIAERVSSLSLMEVAMVLRQLEELGQIYKADNNKYFPKIEWETV